VEGGVEIFEKNQNLLELENFKRIYGIDGLDMTRNIQFVDFSAITYDMISLFFE